MRVTKVDFVNRTKTYEFESDWYVTETVPLRQVGPRYVLTLGDGREVCTSCGCEFPEVCFCDSLEAA